MNTITKEQFEKDIKSKTPTLVDFYADWCGPCKMLGPVLDELAIDPDFKGKISFAKLDTEQYPELAQDHGVQGIPCLIVFKEGKEINRIVGFAPKIIMKTKIKSVLESSKK